MAGFVNFKYRDGIIPALTKSKSNSPKCHCKKCSYFYVKIKYFPNKLLKSERPTNAPKQFGLRLMNMSMLVHIPT